MLFRSLMGAFTVLYIGLGSITIVFAAPPSMAPRSSTSLPSQRKSSPYQIYFKKPFPPVNAQEAGSLYYSNFFQLQTAESMWRAHQTDPFFSIPKELRALGITDTTPYDTGLEIVRLARKAQVNTRPENIPPLILGQTTGFDGSRKRLLNVVRPKDRDAFQKELQKYVDLFNADPQKILNGIAR